MPQRTVRPAPPRAKRGCAHQSCAMIGRHRVGNDGQALLLRSSLRRAHRERSRHQGRLPQAGDAVPSGPQSGRQGGRAPIQGNQRGLRGPEGPRQARGLRSLRPRRVRARLGGGPAAGFGADFATTFSDIFDDLFGMGGRRGRGSGRERGADLRYNMEICAAGSLCRQDRADPHPDLGHLRSLLGLRRQARHQAEGLPDVRRPGQGARTPKASSRSSALVRTARGAAR